MASPHIDAFNFPHSPPPPSPSSDENTTTVIVIVFVSFGGLLFLAFLAGVLCFCIKKMKKNKKKTVQETDVVDVDEHLKVKEAIVKGPHGPEAVMLSIEDDVHIQEEIRKNEKFGEVLPAKSAESIVNADDVEVGASSSGINNHHHLQHKA